MTYADLLAILTTMSEDEDQKGLLEATVECAFSEEKFEVDIVQSGTTQSLMLIPRFAD